MVIAVNTIEVAVEQHRQILSIDGQELQMLEIGEGDHLVFGQCHFLMVYLQGNASLAYPYEFIQTLFFLQVLFGMIACGQCKHTFQFCLVSSYHNQSSMADASNDRGNKCPTLCIS